MNASRCRFTIPDSNERQLVYIGYDQQGKVDHFGPASSPTSFLRDLSNTQQAQVVSKAENFQGGALYFTDGAIVSDAIHAVVKRIRQAEQYALATGGKGGLVVLNSGCKRSAQTLSQRL